MKIMLSSKRLLLLPLFLITALFAIAFTLVFMKFRSEFVSAQLANQQKMTRIIHQSLNLYFEKLKFITENAVLQEGFAPENSKLDDQLRFQTQKTESLIQQAQSNGIKIYLDSPFSSQPLGAAIDASTTLMNWQIFKGLPESDTSGRLIARDRRVIARNILKTFQDIHYVFEMEENGNLVFLEPFAVQKNVTSFNYEYRDYLSLAKSYRATAISEGYISHDQNRTQIITVATPIFDRTGKMVKVFAASVSASTLRENVFRALKESMAIEDGTVFYLIDRHGHVVASSSGRDIYFPKDAAKDDEKDQGNLRYTGFFRDMDWRPDVLEKGNIWERSTKSWDASTLKKDFFGQYINLSGAPVFGSFFPISISGTRAPNWGILIETPMDSLTAAELDLKRIFALVGLALLAVLAGVFILLVRRFRNLEQKLELKQSEIAEISAQVSHDIRSPLSALNMVVSSLKDIPENKRIMIRSSVHRITDIANQLLHRNSVQQDFLEASTASMTNSPTSELQTTTPELLPALIETLVSEKRLQFRDKSNITIETDLEESYGAFAKINATDFTRVLSNLINNAVEAIEPMGGKVAVSVRNYDSKIVVSIRDNGPGIPAAIIDRLGLPGVTYGKEGAESGWGLGIYYAKKTIEALEGKFIVNSQAGVGTEMRMILPSCPVPDWFVPHLRIASDQIVVALDDDQTVLEMWRQRFQDLNQRSVKLHTFISERELSDFLSTNPQSLKKILFLVDYEFVNEHQSGLDIIEKRSLQEQSILVSSHFDEKKIRQRCMDLGVKLIPKTMAGSVPIDFTP